MSFSCTKTRSSIKGETYRWHTLFKSQQVSQLETIYFCCTLCMYSISDNKADFELGNVHFASLWFMHKTCGEAWVDCVYSVCTLTVKRSSCGHRLVKGEVVFFSLCRAKVHCFTLTASTQLHKSKHVKNEKTGKKKVKDGWGKKGAGWCHPFYSNKEDPVSRENTKYTAFFFAKMPKWWATATKTKMAKGGGKPNQWGVSTGNQIPEKHNDGISCPSG